jgi:GH15 family glucan-1,4-alpha-glucosidase
MYGIERQRKLTERILYHLNGYENSKPVRVGNDAYKQKQNDIYGILMDIIYQEFHNFKTSLENSEMLWTIIRSIVKTVQNNWEKPDRGIWEIRSDKKHYTFSKVLCWVAIDRAIKVAELINMKRYIPEWNSLKNTIREEIFQNAWNSEIKSFTQSYDSNYLDASVLLMEPLGFIDSNEPQYKQTVHAVEKDLMHNGLMYRYKNPDGFGKPSSSFTICSFWLINALYKTGEKRKAIKMFDQLLKYSNHLGLFSEDIDFESKRLLGNFPQAYSHLALIETAILLSKGEITTDEKILDAIN